MPVEFGLDMRAGPPKGQLNRWVDDLDQLLPQLEGHIHGIWMTDHFQWEDNPTFEAWTALSFAAARWPQFALGPIVLGQSYRNPAMMAKMAATLQTLTNGRLTMAIGAGWKEDEYHAYGYDYPRPGIRLEQLEDTLEIFKRMWTEPGQVTYHGKHYSVVDAWCEPKPDPLPTLIVGGGGYKTIGLAVRFADWWNIPDANYETYAERAAVVRERCEEFERDPESLRFSWFGRLVLGKTEAEAKELGGKWTMDNAFAGTPDQVVEGLLKFVDLGVDYYMFDVLGMPDPDIIGMMLEDVFPKVRAAG